MYVLILLVYFQSPSITQHDYSNVQACETAGQKAVTEFKKQGYDVNYVCVSKGNG